MSLGMSSLTVATSLLGSGTADSTAFLRGDSTWSNTIAARSDTLAAFTVNASSGAAAAGMVVNVTNAVTDALQLNGVNGTIGPDVDFLLGGAAKGFIGLSSKANEGFAGAASGDMYLRTQGGRFVITLSSIGANPVDIYATGTFTGTLTGCTTTVTGTMTYSVACGVVTIFSPTGMTGTSNANTLTMTGLPAAIQPVSTQVYLCSVEDNGVNVPAFAQVSAGGTIAFVRQTVSGANVIFTASAFTTTGVKGLNATSFTYSLK